MESWLIYVLFMVLWNTVFVGAFYLSMLLVRPSRVFWVVPPPGKKEARFYEKLGIKKWKDYAPCLSCGADRTGIDFLKTRNVNSLRLYTRHTMISELLHWLCFVSGWVGIVFMSDHLAVALIVAAAWSVMQLPFIFILRYNLYRARALYARVKSGGIAVTTEKVPRQYFVKLTIGKVVLICIRIGRDGPATTN